MSEPIQDDAAGLLITARNLTTSVNDLAAKVTRSERLTYALAISLALDVLLTLALTILGYNVRGVSECQAQQNAAFREAANDARAARDKEDNQQLSLYDAQLTLFNTVLDPTRTQAQKNAASNAYRQSVLAARAAIIATKQSNADNPFPTGNCS